MACLYLPDHQRIALMAFPKWRDEHEQELETDQESLHGGNVRNSLSIAKRIITHLPRKSEILRPLQIKKFMRRYKKMLVRKCNGLSITSRTNTQKIFWIIVKSARFLLLFPLFIYAFPFSGDWRLVGLLTSSSSPPFAFSYLFWTFRYSFSLLSRRNRSMR